MSAHRKKRADLSTNPPTVRGRIRAKHADMNLDIELLNIKPLNEWSLAELAHGKPVNRNGNFTGRVPKWMSPKVAVEVRRRLQEMTLSELSANVGHAIKTVHNLMDNEDVDDEGKPIVDARLKLDAAKFIIEHVIGKPNQRVDIDISDTLADMLAGALVNPDGTPAHPMTAIEEAIDVEWTEDDNSE